MIASVPEEETWRPVPGYEGWYEASDQGRVRSVERVVMVMTTRVKTPYPIRLQSKVLRPALCNGYRSVMLWKQHVAETKKVSTLVLETFVGARPGGHYTCHADGNSINDRLTNLYWGTPTQNSDDKRRHGTHIQGEQIPWSKLTANDVRYIRRARGKESQDALAAKFGVTQSHISRLQNGKEWCHIPMGDAA